MMRAAAVDAATLSLIRHAVVTACHMKRDADAVIDAYYASMLHVFRYY